MKGGNLVLTEESQLIHVDEKAESGNHNFAIPT